MQECNSPRNNQLKTHSDEALGSAQVPARDVRIIGIDFPMPCKNSYASALSPARQGQ